MKFIEYLIEDWNLLNEKAKSKFEKLQANKIPLEPKEREICLKRKAVWHNHPNPKYNPTPSVWKSKNKDGKITYVTNTHRAYDTAQTLKGAIKRFHNFIKGTA